MFKNIFKSHNIKEKISFLKNELFRMETFNDQLEDLLKEDIQKGDHELAMKHSKDIVEVREMCTALKNKINELSHV